MLAYKRGYSHGLGSRQLLVGSPARTRLRSLRQVSLGEQNLLGFLGDSLEGGAYDGDVFVLLGHLLGFFADVGIVVLL